MLDPDAAPGHWQNYEIEPNWKKKLVTRALLSSSRSRLCFLRQQHWEFLSVNPALLGNWPANRAVMCGQVVVLRPDAIRCLISP
jgi:hypothetical protein